MDEKTSALKLWYYRDPDGNVQGPFSSDQMQSWSRAKFFFGSLPIRFGPHNSFHLLKDVFPELSVAFTYIPTALSEESAEPPAPPPLPKPPVPEVPKTSAAQAQASQAAQLAKAYDQARQAGLTGYGGPPPYDSSSLTALQQAAALQQQRQQQEAAARGLEAYAATASAQQGQASAAAYMKAMLGLQHSMNPYSYEQERLAAAVGTPGLLGGASGGAGPPQWQDARWLHEAGYATLQQQQQQQRQLAAIAAASGPGAAAAAAAAWEQKARLAAATAATAMPGYGQDDVESMARARWLAMQQVQAQAQAQAQAQSSHAQTSQAAAVAATAQAHALQAAAATRDHASSPPGRRPEPAQTAAQQPRHPGMSMEAIEAMLIASANSSAQAKAAAAAAAAKAGGAPAGAPKVPTAAPKHPPIPQHQQQPQPQQHQQGRSAPAGGPPELSAAKAKGKRKDQPGGKGGGGDYAANWQAQEATPTPPPPNPSSAADFPSLGGTDKAKLVIDPPKDTGGFWERPARVRVVEDEPSSADPTPAAASAATKTPSKKSTPSASTAASSSQAASEATRRAKMEELIKEHGISIEPRLASYILGLHNEMEVLDYLKAQVPHDDVEKAQRFAQAFSEQRLGAAEGDGPPGTPKAAKNKKRGKGREVDPSLLGFTMPHKGTNYVH